MKKEVKGWMPKCQPKKGEYNSGEVMTHPTAGRSVKQIVSDYNAGLVPHRDLNPDLHELPYYYDYAELHQAKREAEALTKSVAEKNDERKLKKQKEDQQRREEELKQKAIEDWKASQAASNS